MCVFVCVQFIDFCILCGCDYLEPLKGVGAKTAYKLIKDNGDLAGAIEALKDKDAKSKKEKQTIPDEWPWEEARELFKHPDVTPSSEVDVRPPFSVNRRAQLTARGETVQVGVPGCRRSRQLPRYGERLQRGPSPKTGR